MSDLGIGLIIFDCDGVLVDSEPLACGAVADGLRSLGIEVSAQDIMACYTGIGADVMYADIERRFGIEVTPAQRQKINGSVLERLAASVEAMPGIAAALGALATRYRLCVASSSSPTRIAASLRRAGIASHFGSDVFSASQVARGKPFPDLFLHAASTVKVSPARCVVVEDSAAGVEAAVAAGMILPWLHRRKPCNTNT